MSAENWIKKAGKGREKSCNRGVVGGGVRVLKGYR